VTEGKPINTSGDTAFATCGYYATYEWSGYDTGFFIGYTNESVGRAL
jgi:hypothetical protein